jgi:hypothetical protein
MRSAANPQPKILAANDANKAADDADDADDTDDADDADETEDFTTSVSSAVLFCAVRG